MALHLITLTNRSDDRLDALRESALDHGLRLEVVGEGVSWPRNAIKLRLLYDHLQSAGYAKTDLVLVVDAFDVVIHAGASELIDRYHSLKADIIFSAEANFYFREPELSLKYWWEYPRVEGSIYHFLNSGSFMGDVKSLISMLAGISRFYQVDYGNLQQLAQIRSDQYLYSRFYADHSLGRVPSDFSLRLDTFQQLFGCTGGRMAVIDWPRVSTIQDYLFFKYERRMLKTFGLKKAQVVSRDLRYDVAGAKFRNVFSESSPLVIHIPGSYERFSFVLKRIMHQQVFSLWSLVLPLTLLISLVAFVRSVLNAGIIRIINRTGSASVFPNLMDRSGRLRVREMQEIPKGGFPSDNPFTL